MVCPVLCHYNEALENLFDGCSVRLHVVDGFKLKILLALLAHTNCPCLRLKTNDILVTV